LIIFHPLLRQVYDYFILGEAESAPEGVKLSAAATTDSRLKGRTQFDYYFAILFILGLHGISALKVLVILALNYRILKGLPRHYIPATTWLFNLCVLFANELCDGYPLASIAKFFSLAEIFPEQESSLVLWAQWLDGFGGLMPRWQILFKVTILRLISYNMDYYWSFDYHSSSPIEVCCSSLPGLTISPLNGSKKKQSDPASLSERDRVRIPAEPSAFNFVYYVAYVLYSPLYLTGPILTFNDYISQQRYPSPSLTKTRIILYGIRFGLTLLCMEFVLHYIYAMAISSAKPDWSLYTPGQLSMLGYFNLHIIWLKLLIPWRFFRLWALLDGIDPPENMVRCMSNNYSALAFWRGWHRSFNRWVVRYLYVPLGGGARSASRSLLARARGIINFLAVFTFVAIWHDLNLRLLMWGWLITLFVLPEVIATMLLPAHRWRAHPNAYRVLCGIGAVGNILLMMVANLVGFAVGLDGVKGLLVGVIGSYSGVAFLLLACMALFVGVQVMFEVRESELRAGIRLKC
jgi:protein-cysteine N-palmitoyltransferase HHAT